MDSFCGTGDVDAMGARQRTDVDSRRDVELGVHLKVSGVQNILVEMVDKFKLNNWIRLQSQ